MSIKLTLTLFILVNVEIANASTILTQIFYFLKEVKNS